MTHILYGFTFSTEKRNVLRIEQYQEKGSIAILWRVICKDRILRDCLLRKPRREALRNYAERADIIFSTNQ